MTASDVAEGHEPCCTTQGRWDKNAWFSDLGPMTFRELARGHEEEVVNKHVLDFLKTGEKR